MTHQEQPRRGSTEGPQADRADTAAEPDHEAVDDCADLIAHGLSADGEELPWTICGGNSAASPFEY